MTTLHNIVDDIYSSPSICRLNPNEIFVFGSNLSGIHGAGAARFAAKNFSAEYGVGEGLTGQCYAFPTVGKNVARILTLDEISIHAERFLSCVRSHPDFNFLLTQVGCGLAGYAPKSIALFFGRAGSISNLFIPREFDEILR